MKYTVISDYFKNDISKSVKFRDFFSLLQRNQEIIVVCPGTDPRREPRAAAAGPIQWPGDDQTYGGGDGGICLGCANRV